MIALDPSKLDAFVSHARQNVPAGESPQLGRFDRELLDRARLLSDRDRLIVELVYRHHVPVRRVGELLNLDAGTVSRLARRLWRRLCDPATRELSRPGLPLPPETLAVAIDHLVRGARSSEIARARGLSRGAVRKHLHFARGFLRALTVRRALA